MPAKSKSQQRLFGMAHAYNKGELPDASPEVKALAKSLKKKRVKEFAKTKHKGLPNKAKTKKKKKKSDVINYLMKLANYLDSKGLIKEADFVDQIGEQIFTSLTMI